MGKILAGNGLRTENTIQGKSRITVAIPQITTQSACWIGKCTQKCTQFTLYNLTVKHIKKGVGITSHWRIGGRVSKLVSLGD